MSTLRTNTLKTLDDLTTVNVTDIVTNAAFTGTIKSVATLTALRALDSTKVQGATVSGTSGIYFFDSTDTTSADNGGSIIVATNNARWKLLNRKVVSFAEFGAINDGVTNSTTQVQAAINYAITNGITLDISGNYAVTTVTLTGASGLRLTGRGSLVGIASVATPSILDMKNVINIAIDGAWFINGNYNTNYDQGVWVYTDGAGQSAAFLDFTNLSPTQCKLGYKFGNTARPDDLVSEINVRGGQTFGCPSVVLAVGAQTVVNFHGCTLASSVGNGDASWAALPQKTVVAHGATVHISGGELLHTALSTGGSGSDFNVLCEVQAIASGGSGNIYGNITVNGALIETAARLATTANVIGASTAGAIGFIGCHGVHTQDAFAFVETDANFLGRLRFKANNFFNTAARTNQNITCGGLCDVFCDEESFGKNFKSSLAGITGGIVHFPHRMVLNVNNLNGQTINNGSATDLKFTAIVTAGDMARFSSNYSAATGIFTVPSGGLKNVTIGTQLLKAGLTGEWYVQINGVSQGVRTLGTYNYNSYSIDSLVAGDTIKIVTLNTGGVLTAASATTDWFQIFASN